MHFRDGLELHARVSRVNARVRETHRDDHIDRNDLRRSGSPRGHGQQSEAFDGEPGALPAQVGQHATALVTTEAVPNQDEPSAVEVPFERLHERDQDGVGVAARVRLKEEAAAPAIPAKRQRARDGQAFPVPPGVRQDRRLAAGSPGTADDGLLGDATFVLEDEPRVLSPGVFFRAAHRRLFHRAMAASSRSPARRAGRWSDHPKLRSTRQTWPG